MSNESGAIGEVEIQQGVEFVARGGNSLKGDLYLPKSGKACPILVAIHGGGWRRGTPKSYRYLGPWLAERGYGVFAVTHRQCEPGRPTFPDAVQDIRAAVQFVKGRGAELRVDPQRVGVMGDSSGAHLAAMVALAGEHAAFSGGNKNEKYGGLSTQVKVLVGIYGVYDLAGQWRFDQLSRPRDHITENFLGKSFVEDRRVYFDASPTSYISINNNSTAALLAWGTEDDRCGPRQNEDFVDALKQANYYVRSVVIAGAPHFWIDDPIDEPGSHTAFLSVRLLRFLREKL
jgi:acetyl esterase/lipase